MKNSIRLFRMIALALIIAPLPTVWGQQAQHQIVPICSAFVDPADSASVILIFDFTALDLTQKITGVSADVTLTRGAGEQIGAITLRLTDDLQEQLIGGRKYSKRFNLEGFGLPAATGVTAKITAARATVTPQVSAISQ